ncbi:MAG TPA: hypothetical protein VH684_09675 [Xanthobacteraceae bacterium]|jgi:hypothetical protein
MSNAFMLTADRITHVKIVVVSLVCATLVASIGIAARVTDGIASTRRLEVIVISAGAPVVASSGGVSIR